MRFAPTFKLYRKLDKAKAADEHDGDAGGAGVLFGLTILLFEWPGF